MNEEVILGFPYCIRLDREMRSIKDILIYRDRFIPKCHVALGISDVFLLLTKYTIL